MSRKQPSKSVTARNEVQSVSTTSIDIPPLTRANNVKSWVYNSDLKYAISDLRNLLMNEAKNSDSVMKHRIQEWVARDYEEAANRVATKDTPVARENEAMRQMISDLLNGPISSLLSQDGRNKLYRLSIPTLPANGLSYYKNLISNDSTVYQQRTGRNNDSDSFQN